jgi:hypothetical protein
VVWIVERRPAAACSSCQPRVSIESCRPRLLNFDASVTWHWELNWSQNRPIEEVVFVARCRPATCGEVHEKIGCCYRDGLASHRRDASRGFSQRLHPRCCGRVHCWTLCSPSRRSWGCRRLCYCAPSLQAQASRAASIGANSRAGARNAICAHVTRPPNLGDQVSQGDFHVPLSVSEECRLCAVGR